MIKNAFSRASAMMSLIAAAMSLPPAQQQIRLQAIGPYESRGKGGKRAHTQSGIARQKRAALKARNIARNRRAHRN